MTAKKNAECPYRVNGMGKEKTEILHGV